jgi:hypothetical protein
VYLDKPVTPQKYLDSVTRILGLAPAADAPAPDRRAVLRQELAALLDGADEATLEAALARLRGAGAAGKTG